MHQPIYFPSHSFIVSINLLLTQPLICHLEECRLMEYGLIWVVLEGRFGGTSILTRPTRGHIPEGGILHSLGNLRSYIALTGWAL
jgi:hypothetical protein